MVVTLICACAEPGAARPPADHVFRLTFGNWRLFTSGYDDDIACERIGARPGHGLKEDWESYWGRVFQVLTSEAGPGIYRTERPDLYLNYIVQKRREAGLAEFPKAFAEVIPTPPENAAPSPAWIAHPPRFSSTKPRATICMPDAG